MSEADNNKIRVKELPRELLLKISRACQFPRMTRRLREAEEKKRGRENDK